jgi:hypothetical protein
MAAPRKVNKSADTGKFVSNKDIKSKPDKTYQQSTCKPKKPKK